MDTVVLVKIVHRIENLTDRFRGILLSELALFTNAIEKLSSSRQLSHNVVFVLQAVRCVLEGYAFRQMRTLDSNQSWNLTM